MIITDSAQRRRRSVDDGGDQAVEAAIVSVQYTDKAGRLNTLRGNADKLLIKKRHRHHPGNWGTNGALENNDVGED